VKNTIGYNICIAPELKKVAPYLKMGIIVAQVKVTEHSVELWNEIDQFISEFDMEMPEIAQLSQVSEARKVYRALGKDPTRYRLSSDSLMRRIVKSQGLYQVNDVVDLNNLLSLESGHSIGTYDVDKIELPIIYGIGTAKDEYVGIGRGPLNIDGLPVLRDKVGCFGSATSDSERSMVSLETTKILMNIIAFDGDVSLDKWIGKATSLLEKHLDAQDVETTIIE